MEGHTDPVAEGTGRPVVPLLALDAVGAAPTSANRRFNLLRQAQRFDPDGAYVHRYAPGRRSVAAPAVHAPWRLGLEVLRRLGCRAPTPADGGRR